MANGSRYAREHIPKQIAHCSMESCIGNLGTRLDLVVIGFGPAMLIQSESVLAQLTTKMRRDARDRSRHLLCPSCRIRTKLYALKDGRKKCSACGGKFSPNGKTHELRLRQCAEILVCFCLDFPAQQASKLTRHRYRLVAALYDGYRKTLAEQNLVPGKIRLMSSLQQCARGVHDSAFCKRCKGRFRCKGRAAGESPVFGVKILADKRVFIDPLTDDEASFRFDQASPKSADGARFSGYAGFICKGTFHRFADNDRAADGAEHVWSWMSQRLRRHRGIWKQNVGLYLKELEWKYNHRLLTPEEQAMNIAGLLPDDFLKNGSHKTKAASK